MRIHRLTIVAMLTVGCTAYSSSSAPDPETTSVRFSTASTRGAILSALGASATEMGMTTGDAGAEAGFWRSSQLRVEPTFGARFAGLTAAEVQLAASLENIPADSVRVTITGTYATPDQREPSLRGPYPIAKGKMFSFYLDSLAAKTVRRLGSR